MRSTSSAGERDRDFDLCRNEEIDDFNEIDLPRRRNAPIPRKQFHEECVLLLPLPFAFRFQFRRFEWTEFIREYKTTIVMESTRFDTAKEGGREKKRACRESRTRETRYGQNEFRGWVGEGHIDFRTPDTAESAGGGVGSLRFHEREEHVSLTTRCLISSVDEY